jgi:hypothetical protein
LGSVDVFLAVGAHQEIALRWQAEPFEHGGRLDLRSVVFQHFAHGGASEQDSPGVDAFGEQVAAGVFGVDEVEVGDVVDKPAVGFLWHVFVEAPIARFHVVDGDPHPLRHHRCDAAVRVAEDQQCVWSFLLQYLFGADQGFPEYPAEGGGVHLEQVIRLPIPRSSKKIWLRV